MRISIVQGAFLPIPPVLGGAVEKIWFALGQEFVRSGHEVTHISRQHRGFKQEECIGGVQHIRVPGYDTPLSLIRLKWRDLLYSRRVLKVLPEADILVTNTFWLPVLAPERKMGRIYVHVQRYPKGQMKFYRKAARLQTVSNVIRNAICSEAPNLAERVTVIPNFVSVYGNETQRCGREKCILYVGRVHPEKGIDLLLESFRILLSMGFTDWKLRVVGPWEVSQGGGGQNYFQSLREKSRTIEHSIEWMGPVFDADQLKLHYRQSSLFVYPSLAARGEASPVAPLEAMAAGCPAVVSSLECFRDYIEPELNGWTFDENSRDRAANLASVLSRVIVDPTALEQARERSRLTAAEYSLARVASMYLTDFAAVCQASS